MASAGFVPGAFRSDDGRARGVPLSSVNAALNGVVDLYARPLVLVQSDQHVVWRGDVVPAGAGAALDPVIRRMTPACTCEAAAERLTGDMAGEAR